METNHRARSRMHKPGFLILGAYTLIMGCTTARQHGHETHAGGPGSALMEIADAVNAGDAERYAGVYAEDAEITIHGGARLVGREAIVGYELQLLQQFPGTRLAFYDIWQNGSLAVVRYGVNSPVIGGASVGHEGLLFFRFSRSGKIVEEHRYLDSLTPMGQLGMLGAGPARPLPVLPAAPEIHVASASRGERDNVALVASSIAAFNTKNKREFLAAFSEDAWVDELVDAHPCTGKASLQRWFETWTHEAPDARMDVGTILGVGDFVLLESTVRATLNGALGSATTRTKPISVHRAVIARLNQGKIASMRFFMNGKELMDSAEEAHSARPSICQDPIARTAPG